MTLKYQKSIDRIDNKIQKLYYKIHNMDKEINELNNKRRKLECGIKN